MALNFLKPRNWGVVKVFRDIENYADWIKTIKREQKNPKSKFNQFKLNRNYFYNVYTIVSLDDADADAPDAVKKVKVAEQLNGIHRYLDEELGFAECLVPEFNQFQDDRGNPTLSYLIMYRFAFNKLSLQWLLRWLFLIGVAATIAIIYL
jgi:hypothetical protein